MSDEQNKHYYSLLLEYIDVKDQVILPPNIKVKHINIDKSTKKTRKKR